MTVGGDQTHRVGAQHEQRTVQEISGVFARNRELCLRHHLAQGLARQRRSGRTACLWQRWKVLTWQSLHARVELVGRNLYAVLVLLNPDVSLSKSFNNLVEL